MPKPFLDDKTFNDMPNLTRVSVLKIAEAMHHMHGNFHRAIKERQDAKIVVILTTSGGQVTFAKSVHEVTSTGKTIANRD